MQICSWVFSRHFRNNYLSGNCAQPLSYIDFQILKNSYLQRRCSQRCYFCILRISVPVIKMQLQVQLIKIFIFKISVKHFLFIKSRNLQVFSQLNTILELLANVCAFTLVAWLRLKRRLTSF